MTQYQFEGKGVLVKPPLQTESALIKTGVTIIPGDVCIYDGVTGNYDRGVAGSSLFVGIAIEGRVGSATEKRPLTVVTRGVVHAVADGAITSKSSIQTGATGKVKVLAAADNRKLRIGRHLGKADGSDGDAADGDDIIIEVDRNENAVEA